MLAEWDADRILMILAIVVPIVVLLVGFVWKWQEKQDTKLAKTCVRTTVLETKVEEHKEELDKGNAKFEGVAVKIGALEQQAAATGATVTAIQRTQTSMDGKIDDLLARGSGS